MVDRQTRNNYCLQVNHFYIARHGETENNRVGRFSGWIDTPLTAAGTQDALSSAAKLSGLKIDRIIASDLGRAFTTAYIIARATGYTDGIDRAKGLREVNYGDLANMPYSAYPELSVLENATFVSPGGESLEQMQARVLSCLQAICENNQNKTVLLVGHDGTINAIRASFAQENMGEADTTHNPHDYVAHFTVEDGKITSFEEVTKKL